MDQVKAAAAASRQGGMHGPLVELLRQAGVLEVFEEGSRKKERVAEFLGLFRKEEERNPEADLRTMLNTLALDTQHDDDPEEQQGIRLMTRMHYVITDGGGQPNVVPPRAEVGYYLRADDHAYVEHILQRVTEIADGAAAMTRTEMSRQIDSDLYEVLPNRPLSELLQRQLERVGPPAFDDTERAFAAATQVDFTPVPAQPLADAVLPLADEPERGPASTDVGNVSWAVPTGGVRVACFTKGAPGHSWQVVACTGTSIGEKGMLVAARALAGATLAALTDPDLRAAAQQDFDARVGAGAVPTSVLPEGQRAPTTIR
jgi:aminobenzoyl-glutamate utilization protein B